MSVLPIYHLCRQNPFSNWFLVLFVITALVTTTVLLAIHSTYKQPGDYLLGFSPTNTRIIQASSLFCHELELTIFPAARPGYNVTLSVLSSQPELTGSENFSIKYAIFPINHTQYVYFYMYPGSRFNVTTCNSAKNPVRGMFSLIKGGSDPDRGNVVMEIKINESSDCRGYPNFYSVDSEDYYYMMFKVTPFSISSKQPSLTVHMHFESTHYERTPNSVVTSCSIKNSYQNSSCRLHFPMSLRGGVPVLDIRSLADTLDIRPLADTVGEQGNFVGVRCVTRGWAYLMIGGCVLGVAVFVLASVMGACACLLKRRRSGTSRMSVRTPLIQ